jgi:D-arabinose 1-dehydrogenase-like Zn-dependent alcohol dehydrogenase
MKICTTHLNLDEAATAKLCAGVTNMVPLRHWNVKKEIKLGVVGLGGLAIWVLNLLMH